MFKLAPITGPFTKRPLRVLLGVAAAALLAGGSAMAQPQATQPAGPTDAAQSNVVPMPAANWLFVQTGTSFTSDGKTLTIKGVAPQTLMFSDRPERMTGDVLTSKFAEFWNQGKDDFQKDPPNATISTSIDDKTDLTVVELLNPRVSGDTLTYDIKLLEGTLPTSGKQISLFIDWWYGPGWHGGWRGGWRGGVYIGGPPVAVPVPGPYASGRCWRGPYGGLHCRPWWGY
ncbi:hypothetical protein WKW79_01010 [Variovorax robiniae]|uniref:Uncharacterized protein n=1 Tax=Variovorax robiniae TaxID=1836199 RepID=A0ABU8X053_9BURK